MSQPTIIHRHTYRHVLAASLGVVWLAAMLLQHSETPALGAELAAAILVAPLTIWAVARHHVTRAQAGFLAVASAPILFMLISSLRAEDPRTALLGTPPQWQGLLLWTAALGWFVVSVVGSDRSNLFSVARVLAIAGVVCSVWALAERVGLVLPYDVSIGNSMALFDNPLSLGQALTVTIAATLALAPRRGIKVPERLFWLACVLLQMGALVAADARAAIFGVAMGVVAFGFTETGATRGKRTLHLASVAAAMLFVLGFGVISLAWNGTLGPRAYERVDGLLTDRLTVWTQVAEQTARSPFLGSGPDRFDAVVTWNVTDNGGVDDWFTFAQHSILLEWLMDTGFVGFLLFGIAAALVGTRLSRLARWPSVTPSIRILVAGCVATFVAMLASWPDPLTLISISVIAGSLVPVLELHGEAPRAVFPVSLTWAAVIATAVAAVTLVAIYSLSPDLIAQYRTSNEPDQHALVRDLQAALSRTHDPVYLEEELFSITSGGTEAYSDRETIALMRTLARNYPKSAEGRTDIPALALEILWMRSRSLPPQEFWRLSRFFAHKGATADSDLGIWAYDRARAAVIAQLPNRDEYIEKARTVPLPDSARLMLDRWETQSN